METLCELRDRLVADLAAVNQALAIQGRYADEPVKRVKQKVVRIGTPKHARKPKQKSKEWNSNGLAGNGRNRGLGEVIMSVIGAAERTNAEIADHVIEKIPTTTTKSVNQTIWVLKRDGKITKGDDLKWRLS